MNTNMLLWGAPAPAESKTEEKKDEKPSEDTPEVEQEVKEAGEEKAATEKAGEKAATEADTAAVVETFTELGLSEWLVQTLNGVSIVKPTEVQRRAIPEIMAKKDVCATACTGSGKTAAYALPILQDLAKDSYGVFACVITPSREITMQVADQFRVFGSAFSCHVVSLVGGVEQQPQQRELQRRPPIVVATPGRLRDTLNVHDTVKCFRKMKYLVLDEADRLLDASFEETMDDILESFSKARYQTLLFSATLSATALAQSTALQRLGWDKRPFSTIDTGETEERIYTSATNLQEQYLFMPQQVKLCYLARVLENEENALRWKSCMVFAASCRECEVVRLTLQELGLPVVSINSLLGQKTRMENLSLFKAGRAKVLVATDVASRGLDIPKVDLVVNYDIPRLSKVYVHRAGRTARAGRSGTALTLVTPMDIKRLQKIEKHIGKKLGEAKINDSACTDLLDVIVAARTRAMLSVNQNFGERLREAEETKVPRDLKREVQEEANHHYVTVHKHKKQKAEEAAPQPDTKPLKKKRVVKKKKPVSS